MITPTRNPVLIGAIIGLIFAVMLCVVTIGAVKVGRHIVDRVETVSGYGIDGVVK